MVTVFLPVVLHTSHQMELSWELLQLCESEEGWEKRSNQEIILQVVRNLFDRMDLNYKEIQSNIEEKLKKYDLFFSEVVFSCFRAPWWNQISFIVTREFTGIPPGRKIEWIKSILRSFTIDGFIPYILSVVEGERQLYKPFKTKRISDYKLNFQTQSNSKKSCQWRTRLSNRSRCPRL